ncbi:uncharacterized protein [Diadema setosum]|uniref:uncharacterized protein n=1 Tax=Diadema setosum TaxID=31175 RepID=UPI003B3B9720
MTFDGTFYSFSGTCSYTLAAALDGTWQVTIRNKDCDVLSTCFKSLEFILGLDVITVELNMVSINDNPMVSFPFMENGISLKKAGEFTFLESTLGVLARWDSNMTVYVTVLAELKESTIGLCGMYDDNPGNDWMMRNGDYASYPAQLATSWEVPFPGEVRQKCAFLYIHFDPAVFVKSCEHDLCQFGESDDLMMDALCVSLNAYSRQCAVESVVLDWRTQDFCPKQCPDIMEYSDCSTLCPVTCEAQDPVEMAKHCPADCVSGCQCPEGTVLDNGRCITADQCPCVHNREKYPPGGTVRSKCNLCTCLGGIWDCDQSPCQATCQSVGDPHYLTFDKKQYNFQGGCRYILVEDFVEQYLTVLAENVECNMRSSRTVTCTKSATVIINGTSPIDLKQERAVFVNGEEVLLPYSNGEVIVRRASSKFVFVEGNGFLVKWDGINRLYITLYPEYMHRVRGLCGTFDSNQNNDFMTPAGDIETSIIAFANKFAVDPDCQETEPTLPLSPCSLNSHMETFAAEKCGVINGDVFRPCHGSVSPDMYYDMCLYDVCGCDAAHTVDCLCEVIAGYATDCANEGIYVDWRAHSAITDYCNVQCDGGQVYEQCGSTCGGTCRDLSVTCAETNECIEGCNCPTGTVLDDEGNCISPSNCPCHYQEQSYPPGALVEQMCQECTCLNGTFHCEGERCNVSDMCPSNQLYDDLAPGCPLTCESIAHGFSCAVEDGPGCTCPDGYLLDGENCVQPSECPCYHGDRRYEHGEICKIDTCNECYCNGSIWHCTENDCPGLCSAVGEGHYTTFDGKKYSFTGDCRYTLASDSNGTFSIEVENVQCGSSGVTCTRAIELIFDGDTTIFLVRGGDVTVNGIPIQLPKYYSAWSVERSGFFYVIFANFGLELLWDGGTRVYVSVTPEYKGRLSGLCGNFDGDQENDFTARNGAVEHSSDNFANSWKVSSGCPELYKEDLVHPCRVHSHREAWAQRRCSIISSRLFEPCHQVVDPDSYLANCIYDSCGCDLGGDCECLCTAIAAYAMECSRHGFDIMWRSQDLCAVQCDSGFEYQGCGSTAVDTCASFDRDQIGFGNCAEGCHCPNGTLSEDGQCIEVNECPCYFGGVEYTAGTVTSLNCQNCTCHAGKLECVGEVCEETCAPLEYMCDNGACVPLGWLCDGLDDCGDNSDETDCTYECDPEEFECASSGLCIDADFYCDGTPDCTDSSDEIGCVAVTCGPSEFQCSKGVCIPESFVCDGDVDCGEGDDSDEQGCETPSPTPPRNVTCGPSEFTCSNGQCVPGGNNSVVCDGVNDCGDMSDEIYCGTTPHPHPSTVKPNCLDSQWRCLNSTMCINATQRCDGVADCAFASDEIGCIQLTIPPTAEAVTSPASTTRIVTTPAVTSPEVTTAKLTTQAVTSPVVTTVVVTSPAVTTSEMTTQALTTPATTTLVVTTPAVSTQAVTSPVLTTEAVSTPAITTVLVSTPAISSPAVTSPAVTTSELTTPTSSSTPAMTTVAVTTPAVTSTSITSPEVTTSPKSTTGYFSPSSSPISYITTQAVSTESSTETPTPALTSKLYPTSAATPTILTTPPIQTEILENGYTTTLPIFTRPETTPEISTAALSTPAITTSALTTPEATTQILTTNAVSTEAVRVTSPVVTTPLMSTPEMTTVVVTSPAITTPAVTTQAVTTPAMTTQAVTSPAVTTQVFTTPAVTSPAATTPEVTTQVVTSPAVSTEAVTTPELTTQAVTSSAVTTIAVTSPAVTTSEMTTQALTTPATTTLAVTTPALTSQAVTSPASTTRTVTTPAVTSPEVTTPEVTTQAITSPAVTTVVVTSPAVTTSEITTQALTTPATTTLAVTSPALTTQVVTSPASTTRIVTTPAVTSPEVTTPELTTQAVTSPAVTTVVVTSPAVTTSEMTTQALTTPATTTLAVTTPALTSQAVTSPASTTRIVTTPAVTSPEVTTAELTTQAVTSPVVTTVVVTSPAVTTSEMTTEALTTPATTMLVVATPAVSTQAVTSPVLTTEAVSTPAITTVLVSTPAISSPAVTSPAVTTSELTTPTPSSTPAMTTVAVTTPAVTSPSITSPEVTTSPKSTTGYFSPSSSPISYITTQAVSTESSTETPTPALTSKLYPTSAATPTILTTPPIQTEILENGYTTTLPIFTRPETTPEISTAALSTPAITTSALTTPEATTQILTTNAVSTEAVRVTTPVVTTPVVSTPEMTTVVVTSPAITTPAVTTQAVTTPAMTTQAVTSPAVTTQVFTTPAVTSPAATTPEVTTQVVTSPAVSTEAVTTPELTTQAVTSSAVTTIAVTSPAVTTSEMTTQALTTPATTTLAVTTPALTSQAVTSPASTTRTVTTPAVTSPEVTTPELTTQAVTSPAVTTIAVTSPAVTTSEMTTQALTTPATTTLAVTTPALTTQAVTSPASTTRIVTTPAVTSPEVTTPELTTQAVTSPAVTTVVVTSPAVTTSEMTTEALTTPATTTLVVTTPAVSTQTVTSPVLTTEAVSTPAITTVLVSTPAISSPAVTSPAVTTSELTTPTSSSTPAMTTVAVTTPAVTSPSIASPEVTTSPKSTTGYFSPSSSPISYITTQAVSTESSTETPTPALTSKLYHTSAATPTILTTPPIQTEILENGYTTTLPIFTRPETTPEISTAALSTRAITTSALTTPEATTQILTTNAVSTEAVRVTTPVVTTPLVSTPEMTAVVVTSPTITTPQVTTQAVTTPAMTTQAVTSPAVTTQVFTTPAVTSPAATTPEVTTQVVTSPAVSTEAVTTPELTTQAVTSPAVTTIAVTSPAVTTSEMTTQALTTPATTTLAVTTPAVTTQAVTSLVLTTEAVTTPAVTTPVATSPSSTTTEVITVTGTEPTTCQVGQFQCDNGNCVQSGPHGQLCDGVNDCGDFSDERGCGHVTTVPSVTTRHCFSDEFTCNDGACVPGDAVCQGTCDCGDCSDEALCAPTCSWNPWTSWSPCTVTCGVGTRYRDRTSNGYCQNSDEFSHESEFCSTDACPTDGNWSPWTEWTNCSANCNGGTAFRYRNCSNPVPKNGGAPCVGEAIQTIVCNTQECETSCEGGRVYSECANRCPSSCADLQVGLVCVEEECVAGCHCPDGTLEQGGVCVPQQQCDCLDEFGASYPPGSSFTEDCRNCSCVNGAVTCSEEACPQDCGWSSWSSWTECTATCGDSTKTRFRSANNPPAENGGEECKGPDSEEVSCDLEECPTHCIVGGMMYETGAVVSQDLCNSCTCTNGSLVCSNNTCDGGWSTWSPWSSCNATCGGGVVVRSRACSMPPPSNGVVDCEGDSIEVEECNADPCPIDGEWCDWEPWSDCTESCAGGYHNRTRVCDCPPAQYGGAECQGPAGQTASCNDTPCPLDCVLSEWTEWTNCSALCDGGVTRRHRNITLPASYGGLPCNGPILETHGCNTEPCGPVCEGDLVVSECANRCPLTCADLQSGTECIQDNCTSGCACPDDMVLQDGRCVNPSDCRCLMDASHMMDTDDIILIDGSMIVFDDDGIVEYPTGAIVIKDCNNCTCMDGTFTCTDVNCAVDCGWSEWTDWSECPQTCGHVSNGIYRERYANNPPAAYGGAECEGETIEFADCNKGDCPCDTNEVWSTPLSTCGMVTCSDLANGHQNGTCPTASSPLEEACVCAPGYYRNLQDECVLPSDCECLDDLGVVRNAGEVWSRGQCETCLCENGARVCHTECEPIICEEGYIAVEEDGECCPVCRHISTPNQCQLTSGSHNFTLDDCIALDVNVTLCEGHCPSASNIVLNQLTLDLGCSCCRGIVGTQMREIELQCPDGSTVVGRLPVIERCECMATDCTA